MCWTPDEQSAVHKNMRFDVQDSCMKYEQSAVCKIMCFDVQDSCMTLWAVCNP